MQVLGKSHDSYDSDLHLSCPKRKLQGNFSLNVKKSSPQYKISKSFDTKSEEENKENLKIQRIYATGLDFK